MSPVGFEPTISAVERSQTHPLDDTATGTGIIVKLTYISRNGSRVYDQESLKIN